MMTIAADQFLRVLIDAQRAGEYPDTGRYYRMAFCCQARNDGAGDGFVNATRYTLDEAQHYAESLQHRADADGNIARCVYIIKTLRGLEVYRTESQAGVAIS